VKIPLKNRVVYFNDLDASVFTKNIDPCKPRGYASQTIMKALSVAIYLGYDKIYLLGVDNTEHRALYGNQANEIWARTDIYYGTDENLRFDYRITTQSGITSAFHQYATWFADFKKFNVGNVYNLDENSLVDAFPKISRITR
jgi:hypothetical protein